MSTHHLETLKLHRLTAIALAVSLYIVGRFGFTDILGLKRIFEVLIFFPVALFGILMILQNFKIFINSFFLLPLTFFVVQFYWLPDGLALADLACATLVVGIILSLGVEFSDRLVGYALKIATIFAVLGIIEFILLLLNPDLKANILLFYDDYSGSTVPIINHGMQLLGLSDGTTYHLWGMVITRLRSFASEPSLLVGYFLVPGALGLTKGGRYALYGSLCILFSICSLAGSVFAALGLTMVASGLLLLRSSKLFVIFPFLLLLFFIWILGNHYQELIMVTKTSAGGYDFLDKTHSANMRFSFIRDMAPTALLSPLGLSQEIKQPLGLIISGVARGGYLGLFLTISILISMFHKIGILLIKKKLPWLAKIGLLIVYGSLITGILYLDNCFLQIFGFTLLLLIYNRLQMLSQPD